MISKVDTWIKIERYFWGWRILKENKYLDVKIIMMRGEIYQVLETLLFFILIFNFKMTIFMKV